MRRSWNERYHIDLINGARKNETKPQAQRITRRIQLYFIDEKLKRQEHHALIIFTHSPNRNSESRKIRNFTNIERQPFPLHYRHPDTRTTCTSMATKDDCCHTMQHMLHTRAANGVWKINYLSLFAVCVLQRVECNEPQPKKHRK